MPASAAAIDLYRQTVLEHCRQPRNRRRLEMHDRAAEGHNALCGDKVTVYLRLREDDLSDVAFEASGCAIVTASASMMTEALKGKSVGGARAEVDDFVAAMAGAGELKGEVAALGGVRAYPSRIRCATLPWQTARAALDASGATVTTE